MMRYCGECHENYEVPAKEVYEILFGFGNRNPGFVHIEKKRQRMYVYATGMSIEEIEEIERLGYIFIHVYNTRLDEDPHPNMTCLVLLYREVSA